LIRLAVRCVPELAEQVLAELTVLAPNGVEEERGDGYVERDLRRRGRAARAGRDRGRGRRRPGRAGLDAGARRLGRPLAGLPHANAAANGAAAIFERTNLREGLPELAPTLVASLTAPVLTVVAAQMETAPQELICSGLLPDELDQTAAAFGAVGLTEADRRHEGDWSALLLRRR
jgi:hypothetical protein